MFRSQVADSHPGTQVVAACSVSEPALPLRVNPSFTAAPVGSWYAVSVVASLLAFRVRDALQDHGYEVFLPTYLERVRWTDRIKETKRQFFPGYLFTRIRDQAEQQEVTRVHGIQRILPSNFNPVPVEEAEIASLRVVVESHHPLLPCSCVPGDLVTIADGPFFGVNGRIVRTSAGGLRLVVGIAILGRAVSVEIDAADVLKVRTR